MLPCALPVALCSYSLLTPRAYFMMKLWHIFTQMELVLCWLITLCLSKDIQCHVWPYSLSVFANYQIRLLIKPNIEWAVNLVIADDHVISLGDLCGYEWFNILAYFLPQRISHKLWNLGKYKWSSHRKAVMNTGRNGALCSSSEVIFLSSDFVMQLHLSPTSLVLFMYVIWLWRLQFHGVCSREFAEIL